MATVIAHNGRRRYTKLHRTLYWKVHVHDTLMLRCVEAK
jgi:hypothetical protein